MKFHWGKGILVFFIFFLSLCATFIIFSLRQNNDLVTDDYYEKGANYSEQIETRRRSAIYEDSVQILQENQIIQIRLSHSIVSQADSLRIYFYRSSDKSEDLFIRKEIVSSPIEINAQALVHGRYQVNVSWTSQQQLFEITRTLDVN